MTESLKVSHLELAFQTSKNYKIQAVDDISFSLFENETLALLGESGCGKSITSLALMRLLPDYAAYGLASKVLLGSEDILELPEVLMRQLRGKRLAIIFQEPMTALNPVLTIGKQIVEAIPAAMRASLSRSALKKKLINLLEEVEVPDPELRLSQYPHQLSGGQKQRVVIAMALANKPEILIADEPTTALDVTVQAQILTLLKNLQSQYNMSLLLITHDLSVVRVMATRVCVMYAGQIVEQASVEDFFKDVKHPYSKQLLAAIPSFNKRPYRLAAISGSVPLLGEFPSGCRFHPRCAYRFSPCPSIMPELLSIGEHEVACHLYPEHTKLPPLKDVKQPWKLEPIGSSQETLYQVKNLCIYYRVGKNMLSRHKTLKAVDDISFDLVKGKTLALVGESGCGKTTVSRAMLGLIPITSGELSFRGKSITEFSRVETKNYRQAVQIIFQDPYSSMNPRMTIGEILAEGLITNGLKAADIAKRQSVLLEQVNLAKSVLSRYPHQFSGGQRQRICIARALAMEPEIIICDEPTSALDVSVQAQILNLLKELQLEYGLAYLFITHNMSVVSYLADDIMVMKAGKLVERGACEQIIHRPREEYTKQLLASVL